MHPGKKSVSSLITASSVVQGGNVCKCMCTRCFQIQTSVQEDSLTCGEHRHTYVCAHLSGWAPANGMWTCSNRQHTFIQSCPKLSAEEHTRICVYFIWCTKTHTYVHPSFLIYIHTCFTLTYLHERSSAGKKVWLPLRPFNLIKATGKIKTKNKNTPATNQPNQNNKTKIAWAMDKGKRPYISTFLHFYEHTCGKMYVCLQRVYILCPYPYTGTFL